MEVFMYLTARTSISICQMSTALCKKLCTFWAEQPMPTTFG
jgi:hypothetical protein